MEGVETIVSAFGLLAPCVPLFRQLFEVVVDVLFELADALRAEGVGDGLSLSRVLVTISRVEETSFDGDEGVVVISAIQSEVDPV